MDSKIFYYGMQVIISIKAFLKTIGDTNTLNRSVILKTDVDEYIYFARGTEEKIRAIISHDTTNLKF